MYQPWVCLIHDIAAPNLLRFGFSDGFKKIGCLFFLEEGFKAVYIYAFIDAATIYSDGEL